MGMARLRIPNTTKKKAGEHEGGKHGSFSKIQTGHTKL